MIIKLYEKIKKIIKENVLFLVCFVIFTWLFYIPLPYYIYTPGGLVDVNKRFEIKNSYQSKGAFYLTYVSEYSANIPVYLLALLNKNFEITKKEEVVASNETVKESNLRSHLLLTETNGNAILNAYQLAGKEVTILKRKLYVTYIDKVAKTSLKVGDQILKVNDTLVNSKSDISKLLSEKKKDDIVSFTVLRDKKIVEVNATLLEINNQAKIGITIANNYELKTNPTIKFTFKENESGPSGGLMMSLAIYNAITKKDITHGLKIAGTGTIEEDGSVGEIGGIEFKVKSAEKEHADIFFTPAGKNYRKAKEIADKNHYQLHVVKIRSLKEALDFLENL